MQRGIEEESTEELNDRERERKSTGRVKKEKEKGSTFYCGRVNGP